MRQYSISMAALWMLGWLSAMLTMVVAGREAGQELHVFQIIVIRSALGLLFLYPLVIRNGGFKALRSAHPWRHIARNAIHYCGQFAWLLALTMIPLAQLVSIEFTMPVWTAILAAGFLGERMTGWKWLAILLGLIGVIIIVRPSLDHIDPGQLVALIAAIGFGITSILTKRLTRTDSALTILIYMASIQMIIGIVPAIYVWQWPSLHIWPWLFLIGFVGTVSHYCLASALSYADATIVVPMDFLRVPLTALLGWLVYQEAIDVYTAAGAMLILCGNLLNLKGNGPVRVGR